MQYKIVHLPKEQWKDQVLPIGYTAREYYDVAVNQNRMGLPLPYRKRNWMSR